jgi:prepilin-type N-terminal cleavage/methylation domain-containing protein
MRLLAPPAKGVNFGCNLGFSLTEVLIALALVGFVAALAMPKLGDLGMNNRRLSTVKSTIFLLSSAVAEMQAEGIMLQTTDTFEALLGTVDFKQRYNTSATATTFVMDAPPATVVTWGTAGTGTFSMSSNNSASPSFKVIDFKNGATLAYTTTYRFGGQSDINAVPLLLDVDGVLKNGLPANTGGAPNANAARAAVELWLYADGSIRTSQTLKPGTTAGTATTPLVVATPLANADPLWLKF